jgi:hypothetical protein
MQFALQGGAFHLGRLVIPARRPRSRVRPEHWSHRLWVLEGFLVRHLS